MPHRGPAQPVFYGTKTPLRKIPPLPPGGQKPTSPRALFPGDEQLGSFFQNVSNHQANKGVTPALGQFFQAFQKIAPARGHSFGINGLQLGDSKYQEPLLYSFKSEVISSSSLWFSVLMAWLKICLPQSRDLSRQFPGAVGLCCRSFGGSGRRLKDHGITYDSGKKQAARLAPRAIWSVKNFSAIKVQVEPTGSL